MKALKSHASGYRHLVERCRYFGIWGDVNGDGYGDIIIGALHYTSGQSREGGAFIYHGGATSTSRMVAPVDTPAVHTTTVKVFPNPAASYLSVQYQGLDDAAGTIIQLLNAQGVLISTTQAGNIQNGNETIDVSRLTPGLYFVIVKNGKNVFREKIIKQ